MSKLYKNLDENNPLKKLIIEINKECERKYGAYHDECGLFRSFCRCDDNKFNKSCSELSEKLSSLPYKNGDISDIGNEIGIILGNYISKENGWDKDSFISGLNHGISLTDGTHG
jgi:hypothetical protein